MVVWYIFLLICIAFTAARLAVSLSNMYFTSRFEARHLRAKLQLAIPNMYPGEVVVFSSGANENLLQFRKYTTETKAGVDCVIPVNCLKKDAESFIKTSSLDSNQVSVKCSTRGKVVLFLDLGNCGYEHEDQVQWLVRLYDISGETKMALDKPELLRATPYYKKLRKQTMPKAMREPTRFDVDQLTQERSGAFYAVKTPVIHSTKDFTVDTLGV